LRTARFFQDPTSTPRVLLMSHLRAEKFQQALDASSGQRELTTSHSPAQFQNLSAFTPSGRDGRGDHPETSNENVSILFACVRAPAPSAVCTLIYVSRVSNYMSSPCAQVSGLAPQPPRPRPRASRSLFPSLYMGFRFPETRFLLFNVLKSEVPEKQSGIFCRCFPPPPKHPLKLLAVAFAK
jgi:hypothetical protein